MASSSKETSTGHPSSPPTMSLKESRNYEKLPEEKISSQLEAEEWARKMHTRDLRPSVLLGRATSAPVDSHENNILSPKVRKAAFLSKTKGKTSERPLLPPTLTRNQTMSNTIRKEAEENGVLFVSVGFNNDENHIHGAYMSSQMKEACKLLAEARGIRKKWLYQQRVPDWIKRETTAHKVTTFGGSNRKTSSSCMDLNGLYEKCVPEGGRTSTRASSQAPYRMTAEGVVLAEGIRPPLSYAEFRHDHRELIRILGSGCVRTYSHRRLSLLGSLFDIHKEINGGFEEQYNKASGNDFYSLYKVDTHVHLAAAFSAKRFTEFIKMKFEHCGSDVVDNKTGETLDDVAAKIGFDAKLINVDTIDVQADASIFNRFDRFNKKYNPCGNSKLRKIFLKSENAMEGRYFAELTQQILRHLKNRRAGNCLAEYRYADLCGLLFARAHDVSFSSHHRTYASFARQRRSSSRVLVSSPFSPPRPLPQNRSTRHAASHAE